MSDKLTLADMMAAMELDSASLTPTDLETLREKEESYLLNRELNGAAKNPNGKRLVGKSFLTRNYTLFSTPYFRIYLQGVKDVDDLQEDDIYSFLKLCTVVPINYRGTLNLQIQEFIENTIESKSYLKFYTDKAFHKAWVEELIRLGGKVDRAKVANRAKVLQTIRDYLVTLETFLVKKGYESTKQYLDMNGSTRAVQFSEGWEEDL